MMESVFQGDDEFGCGIACVAMLCNVSFNQAKRWCGTKYQPDYGINATPLLAILQKRGLTFSRCKSINAKEQICNLKQNDALIYGWLLPIDGKIATGSPIDPKPNLYDHWAVWDHLEQVIRDPYGFKQPFWPTHYYKIIADD